MFITTGTCRQPECGLPVWWYWTPKRKRMPIDYAKHIPHFWCCPARKRKHVNVEHAELQLELFPW